jgi:arsenite methyltransferase
MAPRFVDRQLSLPTGFAGFVIGLLMNRNNAKMNAFAVQQLTIAPTDHVLEIGFGGGGNLPRLIHHAGFVAGVDRSFDVVRRARKRFAAAVAAGRAGFRVGAVEALPFEAGAFQKACTVNTVYFWTSLAAGCAEIHRVLSSGGRVAIGFLPKERMERMRKAPDIFTLRTPDEVVGALQATGFADVRVTRPEPTTPWTVVLARRQ